MRTPIVRVHEGRGQAWIPTTLRDLDLAEADLERLIGEAPELLGLGGYRTGIHGPYAAFHQCQVETPTRGTVKPDIVFLTASGHVVVVEVKLADNPELKGRKVLAQLVEYAAAIASYSEEELSELFDPTAQGGKFSDLVRKRFPDVLEPAELAAELVRRVRAAEIHLAVACDRAPEGLRELVAAATAQSALGNYELSVVELVPYTPGGATGGDFVLVPRVAAETQVVARTVIEVKGGVAGAPLQVTVQTTSADEVQENLAAAAGKPTEAPHPQIVAVTSAYERMAEPGTSLVGRAASYRFVVVEGWPGVIHYEFLHRKSRGELGAELHFEAEKWRTASSAVRDAKLQPSDDLPGLAWDQGWGNGKGRLRVVFPNDTDPERVARAMVALIRKTRAIVDEALRT